MIAEELTTAYDLGTLQGCQLWFIGTTDSYLVTTTQGRYILRLYGATTRTDDDIRYELMALQHLQQKGVSVAVPIRRRDGAWFRTIEAPEGSRQQVLFTYAEGREAYLEEGYAERFGRSMAELHNAADDFVCPHGRFQLDAAILLERPLRWMQPFLADRPDEWQALLAIAARFRQRLATHSERDLDWGFCHGDALGSNAHLAGDTITHFDFNDCGPGWRAYDLAAFLWIRSWYAPEQAATEWQAYLQGYRAVRPLADVDLDAVSVFVGLREFWIIGQQVYAATLRGHWWVKDDYFAQRINFLRKWEDEHLLR